MVGPISGARKSYFPIRIIQTISLSELALQPGLVNGRIFSAVINNLAFE